jgi:hypothetical protein
MFAFLLFVIFCVIVWALFRGGHWGIATFLIIAFLEIGRGGMIHWGELRFCASDCGAPSLKSPPPRRSAAWSIEEQANSKMSIMCVNLVGAGLVQGTLRTTGSKKGSIRYAEPRFA